MPARNGLYHNNPLQTRGDPESPRQLVIVFSLKSPPQKTRSETSFPWNSLQCALVFKGTSISCKSSGGV